MDIFLRIRIVMLIGWLIIPTVSYADDEQKAPLVEIISPHKGEVVDSTFEVIYQLQSGIDAHYVHIFLDGDYQKYVTSRLENVKQGPHEVMIKVSMDEQGARVGWDSVNFTVK